MKPQIANTIKIISTLAMTSALALVGWNLSLHLNNQSLPPNLQSIFWLASIALTAHGIEGFIAAIKASSGDQNPFTYGIYTFFVGFIGLKELFDN